MQIRAFFMCHRRNAGTTFFLTTEEIREFGLADFETILELQSLFHILSFLRAQRKAKAFYRKPLRFLEPRRF